MTTVRKITIGMAPNTNMHRVRGMGGQVVDKVLELRLKTLPQDYFDEILIQNDQGGYRITGKDGMNALTFNQSTMAFTRDFYDSDDSFDFVKVLDDFSSIWSAYNSVMQLTDVRRIGIVAEFKYHVPNPHPSIWMREKLAPVFESNLHTAKFQLRFEERTLAPDGLAPDPKKADFLNTIYQIYDSEMDAEHSTQGFMYASLDTQRYFTPLINGKKLPDEVLKLKKSFDSSFKKLDSRMKGLGATDAKK